MTGGDPLVTALEHLRLAQLALADLAHQRDQLLKQRNELLVGIGNFRKDD